MVLNWAKMGFKDEAPSSRSPKRGSFNLGRTLQALPFPHLKAQLQWKLIRHRMVTKAMARTRASCPRARKADGLTFPLVASTATRKVSRTRARAKERKVENAKEKASLAKARATTRAIARADYVGKLDIGAMNAQLEMVSTKSP